MTWGRYEPMLAVPWPSAFDDPDWSFELKWDGIRAVVAGDGSRNRMWSRRGREITDVYPEVAGAALPQGVVLDGEVVALDADGRPSFELLQQRMNLSRPAGAVPPVHCIVFDALEVAGRPMIDLPYEERRAALEALELPAPFVVGDRIVGDGVALFEAVRAQGLEGIVAKHHPSPYRPGVRSPDWRKIVHMPSLPAVVGGFLPGDGRRPFQSLVLGLWDGSGLRCIGTVGSGFGDAELVAIRGALDEMLVAEGPFLPSSPPPTGTIVVNPVLVVRVAFRTWTAAGRLRHPVFRGVDGTPADEVTWQFEGPVRPGTAPEAR